MSGGARVFLVALFLALALLLWRFGTVADLGWVLSAAGAGALFALVASLTPSRRVAVILLALSAACGVFLLGFPGPWTLVVVVVAWSVALVGTMHAAWIDGERTPAGLGRALALGAAVVATIGLRVWLQPAAPLRVEDWLLLDQAQGLAVPSEFGRGHTTAVLLALLGGRTFEALFALNTVACGLYAVPAYLLATSWFRSRLAGGLAVLLIAANPYLSWYGRTGDYHAIGNLAFLAAVAAAFAYRIRQRTGLAVLAVTWAILAVMAQAEVIVLLVPLLPVVLFFRTGAPLPRRRAVVAGAVACVVALAPRVRAFLTPDPIDIDPATGAAYTFVGSLDGALDGAAGPAVRGGLALLAEWMGSQVPAAFWTLVTESTTLPVATLFGIAGVWVLLDAGRRWLAAGAGLLVPAFVVLYYGTHQHTVVGHSHQDVLPIVLLGVLGGGAVAWVVQVASGWGRVLVVAGCAAVVGVSAWTGFDAQRLRGPGHATCEYRFLVSWMDALPDGANVCAFRPARLRYLGAVRSRLRDCDAGAPDSLAPTGGEPVWVVLAGVLDDEASGVRRGVRTARDRADSFAAAIGYRIGEATPAPCGVAQEHAAWLLKAEP